MSGKSNVKDVSFVNYGSQINKRAAVNWTIGKLINIVLLTIVMALIIFGLTTGGLNPLIENVESRFDEVLIMLNIKDDVSFEACFSAKVAELGGGEEFLREVGLEGSNVVMNVCRSRLCNFTGNLSEYRNKAGSFDYFDGNEWNPEFSLFSWEDLDSVRFNWELYGAVSDILRDAKGLNFIAYPKSTGEFVLYGDGAGLGDQPVSVAWRDGVWIVKKGGLSYPDDNDTRVIDGFAKNVDDAYDDKVLYNDGGGNKSIWVLVGKGGGDDELDSESEVIKLKSEFAKIKAGYLKNAALSSEAIENLTTAISGRELELDGKIFVTGVQPEGGIPVITLDSGDIKLGMKYVLDKKYKGDVECDRVSLPFALVEWDGSWKEVDSKYYYKIEEKSCFDDVYRKTLIDRFLSSKCR